MTTILESLENAKYNLDNIPKAGSFAIPIIKEQLQNSIILLEKGYPIHTDMDKLLDKYPDLTKAPEHETNQ